MKQLLAIFFTIISFNISAIPTNHFLWGQEVDVAYLDIIEFQIYTDINANSLILTIEEYGSFECEVELEQTTNKLITAYVSWSPGSDLSGCTLTIKTNLGEDLGSSSLYMNY